MEIRHKGFEEQMFKMEKQIHLKGDQINQLNSIIATK